MEYTLAGEFLEACDCTVICPCWVDDDPVGGHCTGFILWRLGDGSTIDGRGVAGCTVVSVSTHSGYRRDADSTTTVLYVDVPGDGPDVAARTKLLHDAFGGAYKGTLGELAEVSGAVVGCVPARITLTEETSRKGAWSVQVVEELPGRDDEQAREAVRIDATGHPRIFDKEEREARLQGGAAEPLVLYHTALSHELQAQGAIVAQQGERLAVRVGALPGGNLEVAGRSGMRGKFFYQHPRGGK
ncbi:MAG: DUF1326 domain-containing protein [Actinomycetota bacterium]